MIQLCPAGQNIVAFTLKYVLSLLFAVCMAYNIIHVSNLRSNNDNQCHNDPLSMELRTYFNERFLYSGIGAIRLIRNGVSSPTQAFTSGIVEIYNKTWGNICEDDHFSAAEASVVCHQLAFTGVSSYGFAGAPVAMWVIMTLVDFTISQ